MTVAQMRAKKVAKIKRLPKQLQARARLLDAIDLVGRLNAVASNRKALVHNHNLGIERERLATHAKGPALEGLSVIGEGLRRNEQRFASDFASAVRGTPRGMTPMGPMGMTPAGNMTHQPQTPAWMLPRFGEQPPVDLPPLGRLPRGLRVPSGASSSASSRSSLSPARPTRRKYRGLVPREEE